MAKAPEIKRYHGVIIEVGEFRVKVPNLPDWSLVYIQYPPGEKEAYRDAIQQERVKIIKVTKERIYFEQ